MEIAGTRYVLLADDDSDDQALFADIFSQVRPDLSLVVVSSGTEAIEHLEACQGALPCLIVFDYNMPPLNGISIIRELNTRPRFSGIPKLIFSTSENIKEEGLCAGATVCFAKPSTVAGFVDVMHEMLQCAAM